MDTKSKRVPTFPVTALIPSWVCFINPSINWSFPAADVPPNFILSVTFMIPAAKWSYSLVYAFNFSSSNVPAPVSWSHSGDQAHSSSENTSWTLRRSHSVLPGVLRICNRLPALRVITWLGKINSLSLIPLHGRHLPRIFRDGLWYEVETYQQVKALLYHVIHSRIVWLKSNTRHPSEALVTISSNMVWLYILTYCAALSSATLFRISLPHWSSMASVGWKWIWFQKLWTFRTGLLEFGYSSWFHS